MYILSLKSRFEYSVFQKGYIKNSKMRKRQTKSLAANLCFN